MRRELMVEKLTPHNAASLIPMMADSEYQALKADIAAHGQREPIDLHNGQILDGRHRYRACLELSIEPKTRSWDGNGSVVDFVVSQNLHRRHLTASQRAAVAVQADAMRVAEQRAVDRKREAGETAGRVSGDSRRSNTKVEARLPQPSRRPQVRDEIADQFGTSPRYIQDAKTLREAAPELLDEVTKGERTLPQAKQELRRRQKKEVLAAQAKDAADSDARMPVWEIRNAECEAILPDLPERARLIIADPPYNIGVNYGDGKIADRLPDDHYLEWVNEWLEACRDALTPDGSLWVLIGDEYAGEYAVTLKRLGLTIRSWIKWFESFGVNCSRNFNRCSRHLFYCVRDPKNFVFHEDAVTRPSDRQTKYADKRAAPQGKLWDNVWGIEPAIPRLTGTCKERVPDFPTQLPLALVTPIVLCASDPRDLVIDPFSGSGTTGVAAIQNGRRYLGIERSEAFAKLSELRLKGVCHA
jgi:site-specific DNA-methyltransferase (adenine-specific)